ncbi:MAG: hypothetical protein KDD82_07870 [Planctomycetes bacterium]|nr:hypothetical protein [Planctomycetota bacterium]
MAKTHVWGLVLGLFLLSGCGTITQGQMPKGPAMFGGIRLDIAIMGQDDLGPGSKVMAGIDMIFSLAGDAALFFPFAVINEVYELIWYDGIDVHPSPYWDNPRVKRSPHAPPPNPPVEEFPGKEPYPVNRGL